MKENKEIKEATEEVRKMSEDEKLRRLAYLREKAILDETSIYDAGIDKGIEQNKIEVVQKMLKENIEIEIIERIVGLSKEEIERIKETIK